MTTIVSGYSTLHGALRAAERGWLRHLDAALCARQLTADQWSMLSNLSSETGITMSELAARSQLAPSSATRHADYLAERGLIFRLAAQDDRRRILIGLSRLGAELVASVGGGEGRAGQGNGAPGGPRCRKKTQRGTRSAAGAGRRLPRADRPPGGTAEPRPRPAIARPQ
ncbi:MarR family winged helix-turn-helix transcriptional regulator [Nocardia brasiliensis]|uniref:MarR family winged helix-turn-helix transcriptional regulator n=1 Tax=Nocardia brasiliensis TaxID=37326 RepID=UPI00245741CF|nr:MarR family transcriptional regulator [Nocardia brasiliensis]